MSSATKPAASPGEQPPTTAGASPGKTRTTKSDTQRSPSTAGRPKKGTDQRLTRPRQMDEDTQPVSSLLHAQLPIAQQKAATLTAHSLAATPPQHTGRFTEPRPTPYGAATIHLAQAQSATSVASRHHQRHRYPNVCHLCRQRRSQSSGSQRPWGETAQCSGSLQQRHLRSKQCRPSVRSTDHRQQEQPSM